MILKWQNAVINILLLRDVKGEKANADTIVRLLSQRKELREKQSPDVFDLRTGKPSAIGFAACLLEDGADYIAILDNGHNETKTAMLACARLIRAKLPVAKVAENLKAADNILQTAAERYLESEDSPEARMFVLARHPNEAMILGATTAFFVNGAPVEGSEYLWKLYQSIGDNSLYNGWSGSGNDEEIESAEKRLQAEVKKDDDLLGVYAYDVNYIRIYKDRVIFSWDEDDSRYHERPLSKDEFDEIKAFLTSSRVDELPPFLTCGGPYCGAKELVMLGRNGGRRIYVTGGEELYTGRVKIEFFAGLEKYFASLKKTNATLKYSLSKEIPGLEIIMASEGLRAATVWKEAGDLRVAASDTAVRKKVRDEIDNSNPEVDIDPDEEFSGQSESDKAALYEKRRYEGYSWYKIVDGKLAGSAPQPAQVEFIPVPDALAVQPNEEQWKSRAAGFEIRTSDDGLYKVAGGKLTRLRKGYFKNADHHPERQMGLSGQLG